MNVGHSVHPDCKLRYFRSLWVSSLSLFSLFFHLFSGIYHVLSFNFRFIPLLCFSPCILSHFFISRSFRHELFFFVLNLSLRPSPSSSLLCFVVYPSVGLYARLSSCFCHTLRRFFCLTQRLASAVLCCTSKRAKCKPLHINALINCGF